VTHVGDLVRHDQVVLGIHGRLHVVAHDAGTSTAGGHRARIGIGQRDLSVLGRLHLFTDRVQYLHLLLDVGDLVLEVRNWLLPMIQAVQDNLGELPELGLADAGYRSEENLKNAPIDLVVALGREGKQHAEVDAQQYPHTAAAAAKLKTGQGQATYRKRNWIAEPPNGWIENVLGFRQFSMRGLHRVRAEWKPVCMALDLRRLASMAA
jgi:hypothetical protein